MKRVKLKKTEKRRTILVRDITGETHVLATNSPVVLYAISTKNGEIDLGQVFDFDGVDQMSSMFWLCLSEEWTETGAQLSAGTNEPPEYAINVEYKSLGQNGLYDSLSGLACLIDTKNNRVTDKHNGDFP